MKTRYLFPLLFIFFNPAWADFSNTKVWHHPLYIGDTEPFLIDLKGEWPTDCHPGEQKPVISEYTGDFVLIEFETIVEHVTCNDVATAYRVLVDMSDVIDTVKVSFPVFSLPFVLVVLNWSIGWTSNVLCATRLHLNLFFVRTEH